MFWHYIGFLFSIYACVSTALAFNWNLFQWSNIFQIIYLSVTLALFPNCKKEIKFPQFTQYLADIAPIETYSYKRILNYVKCLTIKSITYTKNGC